MSGIRPWNAEHGNAVVQAGFGVVFRGSPTPEQVRELAELHPELKESHPRMRVMAKGWQPPTQVDMSMLEGVAFDNVPETAGGLCAIRLGPRNKKESALTVNRDNYTGWDVVWKDTVREIFHACLPKFHDSPPVLRVELNFLNRFRWTEDPKEFRLEDVFRPDIAGWLSVGMSPYGSGFSTFKQKQDQDTPQALSGAVVVDVIPPREPQADETLWINLMLYQRHEITEGSVAMSGRTLVSGVTLDTQMDAMHDRCRKTLRCLLNDEVRAKINLGD